MGFVGGGRLPGPAEVREFLSHLAVDTGVVVATQKQALNALAFYLKRVRGLEAVEFGDFRKARVSQRRLADIWGVAPMVIRDVVRE